MSDHLRLLWLLIAALVSTASSAFAQHAPPPIEPGTEEAFLDARLDELAGTDDPVRAAALVRLAFTAADPVAFRGQLDLADELFGRVLEAAEAALEDRTAIGELLCHATRVPMWREEFPVAEEGLRAALEDLEPRTLYAGIAGNALAICVDRQDRPEEALEIAEAAVADLRVVRSQHADVYALTLNTYAVVLSKLNRDDEARSVREEIGRLLADSGETMAEGSAEAAQIMQLEGHGQLSHNAGRWEDCDRYYARAIELADSKSELVDYQIDLRDWYGTLLCRRGEAERAVDLLREAADLYEGRRTRLEDSEVAPFTSSPWEPLAEALALTDQPDEAMEALDRHRGRAILDRRLSPGEAIPTIDEVRSSLGPNEALIGWLYRRETRGYAYVLRSEGPVRWFELPVEQSRRQADLGAYWKEAAVLDADPLSAPDVEDSRALARACHRAVFAPLEPALEPTLEPALEGVDTLLVVAAQGMDITPLASVLDEEGRWLADRFAITNVPSGAVHAWLRRRDKASTPPDDALLLGDPPFRAKHRSEMTSATQLALAEAPGLRRSARREQPELLPRLVGTRAEIDFLARRLSGADVLLGTDATLEILRARKSTADLLHLATHARFVEGSVTGSAIYLACDENGVPSALPAREIARDWDLRARLVTLSACSTGREWQTTSGAELGFPQAFLSAGAHSVLASAWAVDDVATRLFMQAFYDAWLGDERLSRARAVQRAARVVREFVDESGDRPYAHPYYWAAFSLYGDGR